MSEKRSYTKQVLLASASSLAFLLSMVSIWYLEGTALAGVIATTAMYLSFLLFGAFVLVPHVPIQTRTRARVIFLVCLPVLLGWAISGVGEGLIQSLDKIIDRYIPMTVWSWAHAVAGGVWVLGLAYATLWTAKLRRSKRFWHYVLPVALVVAILIFGVDVNFCWFYCSNWNGPVMLVSGVLLLLVTPAGVTTALHFGTEAC